VNVRRLDHFNASPSTFQANRAFFERRSGSV
jgi:hypothetical protein